MLPPGTGFAFAPIRRSVHERSCSDAERRYCSDYGMLALASSYPASLGASAGA